MRSNKKIQKIRRITRIPRFKFIRARIYGTNGEFRFYMDVKYIPGETIQQTNNNMTEAGEKEFYTILRSQRAYMKERGCSYPRARQAIFDNGLKVKY